MDSTDIDPLHKRAIDLWLHSKLRDRKQNPASAVYFTLMDDVLPSGAPEPQTIMDLCDLLDRARGKPPLSAQVRIPVHRDH